MGIYLGLPDTKAISDVRILLWKLNLYLGGSHKCHWSNHLESSYYDNTEPAEAFNPFEPAPKSASFHYIFHYPYIPPTYYSSFYSLFRYPCITPIYFS